MKIFGQDIDVPQEFEEIAKTIVTAANAEIDSKSKTAAKYTQDISLKKIADILGMEKDEREKINIKDGFNLLANRVVELEKQIIKKPEEENQIANRVKELEAENASLQQKMETEKNNWTQNAVKENAYNDVINAAGMIGLVETERQATLRDVKEMFGVDFKDGKAFFLNNDGDTPTPIVEGDKYANIEKIATIVKEKLPNRFQEIKGGMGGFPNQKGQQTQTKSEPGGQSWTEDMASVHP